MGRTPLHKAVAGGRHLAVMLLLDAWKKQTLQMGLDQVDAHGLTPSDVARDMRLGKEHNSVKRQGMVSQEVLRIGICALNCSNELRPSTCYQISVRLLF
jgi:hypothetical protein